MVAIRLLRAVREDVWSWTNSSDGQYFVKLAYSNLIKGMPTTGTPEGEVLLAVSRI